MPSSSEPCWSELFSMIPLSWVALHNMFHSFIELCKPLCPDKPVISEAENILIYFYKQSSLYVEPRHIFLVPFMYACMYVENKMLYICEC